MLDCNLVNFALLALEAESSVARFVEAEELHAKLEEQEEKWAANAAIPREGIAATFMVE
jgi:hypothetical protein